MQSRKYQLTLWRTTRGAVLTPDPNKIRINIRLDGDIIEHFKQQVNTAGGGLS